MKKRMFTVPVALLVLMAMFLTACTGNTPTQSETGSVTESESVTESASESASESENGSESTTASETPSETSSESQSETQSETESQSETKPEIDTVPEEQAACYVLSYVKDRPGRIREKKEYYASVADAVAANPKGADIWLCREASPADRGVVFPETGDFALHTVQYNYDFREYYQTGIVYEITEHYYTERAYFTSFNAMLGYFSDSEYADYRMPLAGYSVWSFEDCEVLDKGKYFVTKNENGFLFEQECGLEYWNQTAYFSVDTRVFYTVEQLLSYLQENPNTQTIHVINDYTRTEPIEFDYDSKIRLAYDGNRVDATFTLGLTFDDGNNGLCYYSDFRTLFACPKDVLLVKSKTGDEVISCLYIWTNDEGYQPGKYRISDDLSVTEEVYDEETGYVIAFTVGELRYTWIEPIESYRDDYLK